MLAVPSDRRCELVSGELRDRSPAGFKHGIVALNVAQLIRTHVKTHSIGLVAGAETGFILRRNPDTVRAPDVAFIRADRVRVFSPPLGYWEGAPDLAVEVLSPSDTVGEVDEEVDDYFAAGTSEVWVVNSQRRTVTVHRRDGNLSVLRETDIIEGGDLLPGFRCPVAEIFA